MIGSIFIIGFVLGAGGGFLTHYTISLRKDLRNKREFEKRQERYRKMI